MVKNQLKGLPLNEIAGNLFLIEFYREFLKYMAL